MIVHADELNQPFLYIWPIQLYTPQRAATKKQNSINILGVSLSSLAKYDHAKQVQHDMLQPTHCRETDPEVSIARDMTAAKNAIHLP